MQGKAGGVAACGMYAEVDGKSEPISVSPTIIAGAPPSIHDIRAALSGRNLACWCKLGEPCHADLLLEWANCDEAEIEAAQALAQARAADPDDRKALSTLDPLLKAEVRG